MTTRHSRFLAAGSAAVFTMGMLTAPPVSAAPPEPATIEVLSNRADLVSGGDALIQINLPTDAHSDDVRVRLGDRVITGDFALRPNGDYQGLVTGLDIGDNTLTAELPHRRGARITITNHPKGGPVFAGPQVQPWFCTTEEHNLGPAVDEQCNAPTRESYLYKSSTTGNFESYDPDDPPDDVATTTTDQGHTVPYIVRVETGTADRSIYQIAVLADPNQPWDPWAPQQAWNGKLVIPFGGDCAAHHRQTAPEGPAAPPILDDLTLSRGFAIAANGLNTLGNNCNEVVSAEALMMLNEHITETLGPIRYAIGRGSSGGAIQQYNIAASYPGLLDGIVPQASFADVATTAVEPFDCGLLHNYFTTTSPHLWAIAAQRGFVQGQANIGSSCLVWTAAFLSVADPRNRGPFGLPFINPSTVPVFAHGTDCGMPRDEIYHPQDNPHGVRCSVWDYQKALYGARASDGFANRPLDNVGVQYGLDALNSGLITPEQFVDLNAKIGGYDIDLEPQPQRTEADPAAITTAYRAGRVTDARQLATVPILDIRPPNNEEVHETYYSYAMRARLDAANRTHANQVIWTVPGASFTVGFLEMDRWLSAIETDDSDAPLAEKVIRNKPVDTVDSCWILGKRVLDANTCRNAFPYYSNPRIAGGAPFTNDVLKCRLKPLERADYSVEFSDEQWATLREAFPTGVCDWRKPGVEQQPARTWLTYADGPGGQPLGAPPTSVPTHRSGKEGR